MSRRSIDARRRLSRDVDMASETPTLLIQTYHDGYCAYHTSGAHADLLGFDHAAGEHLRD
jgi:hypothetical protein